jgi:hypothetical protein
MEQPIVIVETVTRWAWECPSCGTYHDDNHPGFTSAGDRIRCLECGGFFDVDGTPER